MLTEKFRYWFLMKAWKSRGIPHQIAEEMFQEVLLYIWNHKLLDRNGIKKFIREKLMYKIKDYFRCKDPLGKSGRRKSNTVMQAMQINGGDLSEALQGVKINLRDWEALRLRSIERGDPIIIDSSVEDAAEGLMRELQVPGQVAKDVERGLEQRQEQIFFQNLFIKFFSKIALKDGMILFLKVYEEMMSREIGQALNVTPSRILQIDAKVRKFLERFKLKYHLAALSYPVYSGELEFREAIRTLLIQRYQKLKDKTQLNMLIELMDKNKEPSANS